MTNRIVLSLLALLPMPLMAVELPSLFSDHAVLQSGDDTPVWGKGRDGEQITVSIAGVSATATAAEGKWMVHLKGLAAAEAGQDLTVKGDTTLTVKDVLIGDVWLCSGQSNMEFAVQRSSTGAAEIPKATDAGIRLFLVQKATSRTPLATVQATWKVCSPESVPGFSAVGYYFGRELRGLRKHPIGLIGSYWGGTPAQAWTSRDALGAAPAFANYVAALDKLDKDGDATRADLAKKTEAFEAELKKVRDANAAAKKDWDKQAADAKATGTPAPAAFAAKPEPKKPGDPNSDPHTPANLYNAMIAPLIPYAITGAIWYQGESNSGAADEYATLFPRMITDWRTRWGRGDFPFLFVHLSSWQAPQKNPVEPGGIPQVRQTQQAALALPKTGMASALDVNAGPDIHPADKLDVGKRLAQVARKVAYGEDVPCDGPRFKELQIDGASVKLTFEHGEGLHVAVPPWLGDKATKPSDSEPASFALCGADGQWKWAKAKIDGQTIVLTSDEVKTPVAAAFAWAPNPQVNVYNAQNLPLLPFVSDASKLVAAPAPAPAPAKK